MKHNTRETRGEHFATLTSSFFEVYKKRCFVLILSFELIHQSKWLSLNNALTEHVNIPSSNLAYFNYKLYDKSFSNIDILHIVHGIRDDKFLPQLISLIDRFNRYAMLRQKSYAAMLLHHKQYCRMWNLLNQFVNWIVPITINAELACMVLNGTVMSRKIWTLISVLFTRKSKIVAVPLHVVCLVY